MKMRNLGVLIGFLGMAAISSAALVDCGDPAAVPVLADQINPANAQVPGTLAFTCGGITFSNFNAVAATPNTIGINVYLQRAQWDAGTGEVLLTFNPNLFVNAGDPNKDFYFYFTAAGPIITLDLTNGGSTNTSIQERGCSTPINTSAGNICTGGIANLLGGTSLVAGGEQDTVFAYSQTVVNPVYIFKDIIVGQSDGQAAHMTSFSQSFHTPVPEPVTFSLMGIGLLGLGLLRKRMR